MASPGGAWPRAPRRTRRRGRPGIGAWLPPEGMAGGAAGRVPAPRPAGRAHRHGARRRGARARAALGRARLAVALPHARPRRAPPARPLRERQPAAPRASTCAARTWPSCSPLLEGQRVLLEPALMQLRFGDEPLRPRFDLELVGGDTHHRQDELRARRATSAASRCSQGGWFEGWPELARRHAGGHRPPRRQARLAGGDAAPPALADHRRADARAARASSCRACPRSRSRSAPSCPSSAQVADVVDLVPTFRMRAGGSLVEAHVELRAAYEDEEIDVRADGMTPPVIVQPPEEGDEARALHPRRHRRAAGRGGQALALGLVPDETGQSFIATRRRTPSASGARASPSCPTTGTSSCPTISSTCRCATKPIGVFAQGDERGRLAHRQAQLRERGRRRHAATSSRAASPRASKYVRLDDGSFAPLRRREGEGDARARGRDPGDGGRQGRQAAARAGGPHPGAARSRSSGSSVTRAARRSSSRSSATSTRSRATKKPRNLKAHAPPVPGGGPLVAQVHPRHRLGRRARRRHGPRQDGADDRAPARREARRRRQRSPRAHRRADQRRHQLAARDRQVRAVARGTRSGTAPTARSSRTSVEGRRGRHHELRAAPPRRGVPREARLDATRSSTRRSTSRTR